MAGHRRLKAARLVFAQSCNLAAAETLPALVGGPVFLLDGAAAGLFLLCGEGLASGFLRGDLALASGLFAAAPPLFWGGLWVAADRTVVRARIHNRKLKLLKYRQNGIVTI